MATSLVLKICPTCKIEISNPPPKLCPVCQSDAAWIYYKKKEEEKLFKSRWEQSVFVKPTSISEQRDSFKGEALTNEYVNAFLILTAKEKEEILWDAIMTLKTLLIANHSSAEITQITRVAALLVPLITTAETALKSGIIFNKKDADKLN